MKLKVWGQPIHLSFHLSLHSFIAKCEIKVIWVHFCQFPSYSLPIWAYWMNYCIHHKSNNLVIITFLVKQLFITLSSVEYYSINPTMHFFSPYWSIQRLRKRRRVTLLSLQWYMWPWCPIWIVVYLCEFCVKVKLRLLYCHPPQLRPATPGLWDSLNCMQSLPNL